jgi:hypothetical protein
MRISIQCTQYDHAVGGSRVMHLLAYFAHCLGHEVDAGPAKTNPAWGDYSHFVADPDVIVMHEVHPESLLCDKVIRWVTFYPGQFGGPAVFPKNELVVAFMDEYLEATRAAAPHQAEVPVFFLPTCDMPGLEEGHVSRDAPAAFWRGKGPDVSCPERHTIITRQWPEKRSQLVRLLKSTKRFYSADPDTALLWEAQLCGCQVFLWNEQRRAFLKWFSPEADRFKPYSHDEGKAKVDIFLKSCFKHFGLEDG